MGKHSKGEFTESRVIEVSDPLTDDMLSATFVEYRCDYNKGIHMVPLANVHVLKTKISKKEAFTE